MSEATTEAATEATGFTMHLVCCQMVILNEIAHKEITQRQVAQTYRMTIASVHAKADTVDWRVINEAIIARWGAKGLERVKKMAWSGKCFGARKAKGATT